MKLHKYIGCVLIVAATACSNDEPLGGTNEPAARQGEIECYTESDGNRASRTSYILSSDESFYQAVWNSDDRLAVCFDKHEEAEQFSLLKGESLTSAVFYGAMPESYTEMTAVYPFSIFKRQTSEGVEVGIPSTITFRTQSIMRDAMPMFARSKSGILNFYNLMAVIKISVRGHGLLHRVTVSSPDGKGLSGSGHIIVDEYGLPELVMDEEGTSVSVTTGSLLLSIKERSIYLPIPATAYGSGLKLEFEFEGHTEIRTLDGPLHFERSVLRGVDPYSFDVAFSFDAYEPKDNEIWYMSSSYQTINKESDTGLAILTNSFSDTDGIGVIVNETAITELKAALFETPEAVKFLKLPDTIEELGDYCLRQTSIEEFVSPRNLRNIKETAFGGCSKLKRVVLNDGIESIGGDAFSNCPNLEYVYLPESIEYISAYSFRQSTGKLDHWDGECKFIDPDRHTLYSNNAYGLVFNDLMTIDVVAACNLTEYTIPANARHIQNYGLSGCGKLKKLIVHEKFGAFGYKSISTLAELEVIECRALTPPETHDDDNFSKLKLKELRVPRSSIEQYRTAKGWKEFAGVIVAL